MSASEAVVMAQSKGSTNNPKSPPSRINARIPNGYGDFFDTLSRTNHPTYPRLTLGQEDLIRAGLIALEYPELVAQLKLDLRKDPQQIFKVIEAAAEKLRQNDNRKEESNAH